MADNWGLRRWRGSLRMLPLLLVALWATPVLWWRDEESIQIFSILELQSNNQSYHCRRFHTLKPLLQKLPAFAPSRMPSSPTQSCLISIRVVASRVSARFHNKLFRFSLMSAISFSCTSFSILWFFLLSLLAPLASGAGSLGCSAVQGSYL